MYSILLKINAPIMRYKFLTDGDGNVLLFNTIEEVEEKIKDLLYTYLISDIEVVKRYEITTLIAVEEMKPESKELDGDEEVDDEF